MRRKTVETSTPTSNLNLLTETNNPLKKRMMEAQEMARASSLAREKKSQTNLEKYIRRKLPSTQSLENKLIEVARSDQWSFILFSISDRSWFYGWDSLNGLRSILHEINKDLETIELVASRHFPVWKRYSKHPPEVITCIEVKPKK